MVLGIGQFIVSFQTRPEFNIRSQQMFMGDETSVKFQNKLVLFVKKVRLYFRNYYTLMTLYITIINIRVETCSMNSLPIAV